MRIICAGDTGVVKVVNPEKNALVQKWGEQEKNRSVTHMCFANDVNNESEVVCAYKDGSIESYFTSTGQMRFSLNRPDNKTETKGLFSAHASDHTRIMVLCSEKGQVEVHRFALQASSEQEFQTTLQTFAVPAPVEVCKTRRCSSNGLETAIAGKNNLLKIFDITTQKEVFKAKNLPNDFLDMQVPIWDKDIAFLSDHMIATCTAYHQIRVYDRRVRPTKPVLNQNYGKQCYTKILASPTSDKEVYLGDIIGNMYRFTFETNIKRQRKWYTYKLSSGSIRGIDTHPVGGHLVAFVSADRYLRVFNRRTRELLHKMYLSQIQNCVLFTSDMPEKSMPEFGQDDNKEQENADDVDYNSDESGDVIYGSDLDEEDMKGDDEVSAMIREHYQKKQQKKLELQAKAKAKVAELDEQDVHEEQDKVTTTKKRKRQDLSDDDEDDENVLFSDPSKKPDDAEDLDFIQQRVSKTYLFIHDPLIRRLCQQKAIKRMKHFNE